MSDDLFSIKNPMNRNVKNHGKADESKDIEADKAVNTMEIGLSNRKNETTVDVKSSNEKKSNASSNEEPKKRVFKGKNIIQYGLWAHYMGYGCALFGLTLGFFAIIWKDSHTYHCELNHKPINAIYLPGTCSAEYKGELVCCEPTSNNPLKRLSSIPIGVLYLIYSMFILFYEDVNYGWGLYFPTDTYAATNFISPIGVSHIIVGLIGLANDATALAGFCLITNGLVYCYAVYRNEGGDGGRAQAAKAREQKQSKKENNESNSNVPCPAIISLTYDQMLEYNPFTFFKRIYNEDKLSSYIWVFIFILINILNFVFTLLNWFAIVDTIAAGLMDGTLVIDCESIMCKTSRAMIRYGPLSNFAPWAKAAGSCLNMDCSLILLPVIRNLLRRLNNTGVSFHNAKNQTDYFAKFFARPMTRYVPLQKNIEFHKMCAGAVFFFAYLHTVMHYANLMHSDVATLQFFIFFNWGGSQFLLGSITSYTMFIMYSAAPDAVRMAKYEIFFRSHHVFIIFFLVLFLHGPVFIFWSMLPVGLYLLERYLQLYRGNRPYIIQKVEWIEPVMAIYFRPVFKEDFVFKEGQYLYANCPHISETEWHPFTISSSHDDLHHGPRVFLETGEEVVEVPRPSDLPASLKWNKFCVVSKDKYNVQPNDLIDKCETGYMDFVSIHVKVHGLNEPYARTWTRKFKEYLDVLNPTKKFPYYFSRRDIRGDVEIGRQFGPDGKPILRIDGPHSAPSEHYTNYGTVMLVGAGIGLTPCASILCALTKYRWKKNFNPEILHFYWIVRQNEVDSFQWLVHMLTELSFELKRGKANNQIEGRYYCEVNIYITGVEKTPVDVKPMYRAIKHEANFDLVQPTFTADELYAAMLNPTVDSKGQISKMKSQNPKNRLQDIWIWNGRPHWDDIFQEMKEQRQHADIGVCFCGAPVIGADLRTMCEKYSNTEDDCLFSLHKENF